MSIQFLRILILNVLMNMGMSMIIPILPVYLKQNGFSIAGLSFPFFILILGRFLSKYYAGQFIHRWGERTVLVACFLLFSGVFFCYSEIHSVWGFSIIRFFEGCVEGIAVICLTDMAIMQSGEQRGKLMGYFGASFGLGFILGPLMGGVILHYMNITAIFYSGALLGLLGIFLSLYFRSVSKNNNIKSSPNSSLKWRHYLPYWGVYLPSLLRRALFFSFMILIPLYSTEHLKLETHQSAFFFSGSAIFTTLLMPFTGKLADKYSANLITFISLIFMGSCILAFGFTKNWILFSALFFTESVAFAFMLPAGMKVFADKIAGLSMRQDIIGYFGSLAELVTLLLALMIPTLYAYDSHLTWELLGLSCVFSALPFYKKKVAVIVNNEAPF